jgi:hypothetical protein
MTEISKATAVRGRVSAVVPVTICPLSHHFDYHLGHANSEQNRRPLTTVCDILAVMNFTLITAHKILYCKNILSIIDDFSYLHP